VKVLHNFHDYTTSESIEDLGVGSRCGTHDTTGREFGMAKLAAVVLGRPRLDVLVYGAGRSLDNLHIAKLPKVRRVAIGDIMRVRDEADFIDIGAPAKETFDVVIASEVIEHFKNPRKDFAQLFSFVHRAGILVCSTNVYDGGNLNRQTYILARGHVSYYTPAALRRIAKANKMHVDFRLPASAKGAAGPRKRYVIFSHSQDVMESLSDYFGSQPYAPSEKPVKRSRADRGVRPAARVAAPTDKRPTALG
jgi:SAM-dependent methyltransferase